MLNIKTINHLCLRIYVEDKILVHIAGNMDKFCFLKEKETKPGKIRLIARAEKALKIIQVRILQNLLYKIPISPHAHGAVPGRSAKTNAAVHSGQRCKFCMDLKSCFPNIPSSRIRRLYEETLGCSPIVAQALTNLTTFNYELAQGFPTSAALVNIICIPVDENIYKYIQPKGLKYSRYIDDITVSGDYISDRTKERIREIVLRNSFILNSDKEIFNTGDCASVITGLNADGQRPVVPRPYKRNVRAAENNLHKKKEKPVPNVDLKKEERSIVGKKQYIKNIEG